MSQDVLDKARKFMYSQARLLERRLFEYHFEGGSKEAVLSALRAYQNDDGGFGHALEPDIRCPYSQPVPTERALHILDEVVAFDSEIFDGILSYLRRIALPGGGFPLVFVSVKGYPHAPWWSMDEDDRPSFNPTGTILGILYKQKARPDILQEEWFRSTIFYAWSHMNSASIGNYHDGIQWIDFLQHSPERERAQAVLDKLDRLLLSPGMIELDPNAQGYLHKALDWAPSPDSYARRLLTDEVVNRHLAALIDQQQGDGGWPLSFEALNPAAEAEWRGWLTLERLRTLRAYGAI